VIADPGPASPGTIDGTGPVDGEIETIGSGVAALLFELVAMLERFAESGERGTIDLRSLPMAPSEYALLRETLGQGEVSAELDLGGPSSVHETGFHAAWWVRHCTPDGEVAAEYIEVAAVPEILLADGADARRGAERLRARIAGWNPSADAEVTK